MSNTVTQADLDSVNLSERIEKATKEITYTCDGPLTGFVVLMRAMRKVAEGGDPEVYGNAYAE